MLGIGPRAVVIAGLMLTWSAFPAAAPPPTLAAGSGVPQVPAATGSGSVVVNEIAAGTYVELRNVSESTVDVGGFNLWLCGATDVTGTARVAFGQRLDPDGFYLLASSSFTGAPADQTYSGSLPSGGAVLLDPEYGWADGVAVVADSPCGEGDPAPVCPQAATARDTISTDTNRNGSDFSCRLRSPGEPNN